MPGTERADPLPAMAGRRLSLAPLVGRVGWMLNRLRCMTPGEIGRRCRRAAEVQAERLRLVDPGHVPAADLGRRATSWIGVPAGIDAQPYRAAADRIVAGRFNIFSLRAVDLGWPPRWNRDPLTGREAPMSFGKHLDYRNPELVGDIKYLWEPNRHLHLVTLAQAWALTGDAVYAHTLRLHLESWFDACPCGRGPNWSSALEAGLRLINWSVAWQLLGGADSPVFNSDEGRRWRARWLGSIYQHARFVRSFLSFDSSANNHLIGEAAGLFVATVTWPHWPKMDHWRRLAQAILEREAHLQNAPDGVNREQATGYQQFVIDLLLPPLLAGQANGADFSQKFRSTAEALLEYLASIMDVGGHLPMFGDADDALVLRLDPADVPARHARTLLAVGAVLFGRPEFRHKAGSLGDGARWLFADAESRWLALPELPAGDTRLPVRRAFRAGGYYILGDKFETPDEVRLIADAGPLGYGRIAAHGHADALSFTLSLGGREFLIDPGTYAYHTQGPWRAWFRGTAAHNTVRVDGEDQSRQGGNFMWLKKASAFCSHWESKPHKDVFEGWHDGYRRLPDPVLHQRRIVLDKTARRILIEDRLQMTDEHEIELFFHCSEDCRVEPLADGYRLINGSRQIVLRLPRANNASHPLARGSTAPILGWISRRFDEKQPTTTLRWSSRLRGNTVLYSQILY